MNKDFLKKDLEIIITVAKEINLRIFLDGGTLLGAIRNNDFVSSDTDFDFGVFREEFSEEMKQKLISGLTTKKMEFKGYEIKLFAERTEFGARPHVVKFWSAYHHWNVDFWVFEKREKDYWHKGWGGYFYFLKETLDTLDEREFLGVKVLVPHNPELYLENLYGKNWKIPKTWSSQNKAPFYPNYKRELK